MPDTLLDARLEHCLAEWSGIVFGLPQRRGGAAPWPSHHGLDSARYLLMDGDIPSGFLKLFQRTSVSIDQAAAATARAGEAGLGPALMASNVVTRAILQQALPGSWRSMTTADADNNHIRTELLSALKNWHGGPPLGWARPRATDLADELEASAGALHLARLVDDWHMIVPLVTRIEDRLAGAGQVMVPIHGDLCLSNVMIDPQGSVLLVDFDHAADGDPLADIASLCLNICEVDADYAAVVEQYLGRADSATLDRVRMHAILEDFRWVCQSLASYLDPVHKQEADFLFYARQRAMRCTHHLRYWDADMLLNRA